MNNRHKILLIEDDIADVELLDAWLAEVDNFFYTIKNVKSLQAGDEVLNETDYDIVLMDLGLAKTRGMDTFWEFKKLKVKLPVIIITGLDDQEVGVQAISEGAQDYLVKGQFDGKTVARAVRYAIARYEIEEKLKASNAELRRLKNELENEVAQTVKMMMQKDTMLISRSHQVLSGEMISNIANQWKQPLASLSMLIQTINDAYEFGELTEEKLKKKTNLSVELINYLANTIDDFREYFLPGRQMKLFEVAPVIEKTINFIYYSFDNDSVRLELKLEPDCYIQGFPNELSQSLINILNNAREVIKERGLPESKRIVRVSAFKENDNCVIEIDDKAGGIASENLEKVFEPHYTSKTNKGTGVGLYLAKNMIERNMQGRLSVRNTAEGACFRIEF